MDAQKAAKASLPLCVVILCFGFYWIAVYKRASELEQPMVKPGTYKGKFLGIQPHRIMGQKLAKTQAGQLKHKLQNEKPLFANQTRPQKVKSNGGGIKLKPVSKIHGPEQSEGGTPGNLKETGAERPKVRTAASLRTNKIRTPGPKSGTFIQLNRTQRPEVTIRSQKLPIKLKIAKSTTDSNTRLFQQATDLRQRCSALKRDGLYQEPQMTKWWTNSRWNIFVLDEYKVLFCVIPRAASTSTRRLLLTLEGRVKEANYLDVGRIHHAGKKYLKTFRNYSVEEVQQRIKRYTKVLIVREPMERLLSAYRAQFVGETLENINKFYNLHLQKVPNFPEFISYLLNRIKVGVDESHQLDAHWCTLEFMSQPCIIQYDMIVRFERLEEDMTLLLKQLHWENILNFPARHASGYVNSKTNTILVEYYSQIPKFQRDELKKFYSRDYRLFGYTYPQVLNQL